MDAASPSHSNSSTTFYSDTFSTTKPTQERDIRNAIANSHSDNTIARFTCGKVSQVFTGLHL